MSKRVVSTEYRKNLSVKILDVAMRLFHSNGIKGVKMDDVARELGISKRTLYEIYPTKEELIFESFKRTIEKTNEEFTERISSISDTMDIMAEFVQQKVSQMKGINPNLFEELRSYPRVNEYIEAHKTRHNQNSRRFFERGMEEGYILKDLNLDMIAEINHAFHESFFGSNLYMKYKPKDIFRTMLIFFVRSVCTPAGIARIDDMFNHFQDEQQ